MSPGSYGLRRNFFAVDVNPLNWGCVRSSVDEAHAYLILSRGAAPSRRASGREHLDIAERRFCPTHRRRTKMAPAEGVRLDHAGGSWHLAPRRENRRGDWLVIGACRRNDIAFRLWLARLALGEAQ